MADDERMEDAHPADDPLEVDFDDADSAVDCDDEVTLDSSVRSSVYAFVEENGRRYHRYKEGRYFFPNDETEQARLDLQHQLFLLTFDDRLTLAPVPTGDQAVHNVLDIGTGTGIWAIDFAVRNPAAHVTGTDLSPIQPSFVPPNCDFEVDDAEDPWVWGPGEGGRGGRFDLIHGRALAACFRDPDFVVNSAAGALAPGGWLEFQDIVIPLRCLDRGWDGSSVQRWGELMTGCARRAGRDPGYSQRYPDMFRRAGLVDVRERRFSWPSNSWVRGAHNKRVAEWFRRDLSDGLEGLSLRLLMGVGGMGRGEVEVLLEGVRRDLADPNLHCYMPV
ncbi:hypothetical protein SLS53_008531 [Cytospora paraplurivora]|uniref:Methyltransferase n=1 Tax=Cytospora paraplurivora TaxID=2898453 RepID=A0AAN9TXR1_9PEZI